MANNQVPSGQVVTKNFPVLSASDVPDIDLKKFRFKVTGEVENPYSVNMGGTHANA